MEAITLMQPKHVVVNRSSCASGRDVTQGFYLSLSASSIARRDPTSGQHGRTA